MFICMSSGYRERYRRDIILALAMPKGCRLQFRYDKKWISPKVLERIKAGKSTKTISIIAYIAQYDKDNSPQLIPCRFAQIEDAKIHGTTVSLALSLEGFAYAENVKVFNEQVRSLSQDVVPKWDKTGNIIGYYWIEIDAEELHDVISSDKEDEWEKIIDQIAPHKDFAEEKCFYMLKGLYPIGSKDKLAFADDGYELENSSEYEVQIYHYHPKESETNAFIRVQSKSSGIEFTTNPTVIVNSRYDFKRVRFKTTSPTIPQQATLSVYRGKSENKDEHGILDFDLKLHITGTRLKMLLWGSVIGILLSVPHLITALTNPELRGTTLTVVCFLVLIVGLITGILAAFKIKKNI